MTRRRRMNIALLTLPVLLLAGPAPAQDFPPKKTVTMVVGFAPGGAADAAARLIAKKLGENVGQTVIVDNKAGAGGNIAHQQVANGPADGSVLLFGSIGPLTIAPHMMKLAYDPFKDLAPLSGGVYFPKDCHLSPGRFMAGLKRQCDAMGVKFVWGTEVERFTEHGGRISEVSTASGKFTADEVILCGGSWSPVIGSQLGLKLPMQAGKGYSLTLTKPRELPQLCSIFTEARVAVTPMGNTLRFGGTMEIAGLNEDINPVRVRGIIKAAVKYFPKFTPDDFAGIQPWRGLRPCSPDGMPYLGRTAKYSNLTIATGHAMMGLSLGPITGRLVSEILSGEKPSFDLGLLNPDRYGR